MEENGSPSKEPASPKSVASSHSETMDQPPAGFSRERRRSSAVPPESDVIVLSKKGARSGSKTSRRGSQAFLTSDDTIVMQFEGRRLSSFCTTSSNDETALSMGEDHLTEEEVSETIRAHKQIITNMKVQNWPMHRKLKVLTRAKLFIKRHEGELKQSKQAKDFVAKYNVYVERYINRFKREFANFIVVITPWEMRIKKIESHFGSVVASYFIFLRWIFWVNIFISIIICCFLMVPEVLRGDQDLTGMRKEVKDEESSLRLQAIWDFEGYLKYSPIFYGYYSNTEMTSEGYRLPLAYFLTTIFLYMFSFFIILRKMAQNARMSRISSKDDEYTFCWKLFTGWDYMIGNSETAYNKVASLVMGFKESILEEKEKKKEKRNWKRIALRLLANLLVLLLLTSSAYGVVLVVERSQNLPPDASWVRAQEVTLVVSGIGIIFPNIFDIIGMMESYHPRIALRWQLGRILILNFLNMYTLMFSLFGRVNTMTAELQIMKYNITSDILSQMDTATVYSVSKIIRVERQEPIEGRWNLPEEFDDPYDDTTSHLPSILNDPYVPRKKQDSGHIEGRQGLDTTTTTEPYIDNEYDQEVTDKNDQLDASTTTIVYVLDDSLFNQTNSIEDNSTETTFISTFTSTLPTTKTTRRPKKTTTKSKIEIETTVSVSTFKSVDNKRRGRLQSNEDCEPEIQVETSKIIDYLSKINITEKEKLRSLCWETMFGQELVKLTIMDFVFTFLSTFTGDFIRALIVRYCNDCTCICWDLEKRFPGYGDFKIAENILHLVNNQGMVWLGMFFSPGLPVINTVKLWMLMYLRSWAVLTCNVPHETVFKASRSNNFYYALLLIMLFLFTLPVGYAVVWLEPSWHCGPFSGLTQIYRILTSYVESKLPKTLNTVIDYMTSPGAVIPLLLLLVLIIYYLFSLVGSLREANNDLKSQIRKEKDISEVGQTAVPIMITDVPTEKKHVRIKEEVMTDSDKTKLLQKSQSTESA